jgi:mannosyltransferase
MLVLIYYFFGIFVCVVPIERYLIVEKIVRNMHEKKSWNWHFLLLCLIFGIGLFIRVFYITHLSFWLDEAYRFEVARMPLADIISGVSSVELSPPLYQFVLHCWMQIFGATDFSARMLSVIFGILTVVLVYIFANKLLGRKVALFAALIAAISPLYINYSQEATQYTMLNFLALLSMILYVDLVYKKESNYSIYAGYILASILALYTHYYFIFILFSQNLFLIIKYLIDKKLKIKIGIKMVKSWLVTQCIIGLLFLPWIPQMFAQIQNVRILNEILSPSIAKLLFTFLTFCLGFTYYKEWIIPMLSIVFISALTFGILFFKGITKKYKCPEIILLLIILMFIPVLMAHFISYVLPLYAIWGLLISAVPFYIIIAAGLQSISKRWLKITFFLLVIVLMAASLFNYFKIYQREDFRSAAKFLEKNSNNEAIILYSNIAYVPLSHYLTNADITSIPFNISFSTQKNLFNGLKENNESIILSSVIFTTRNKNQFWFVFSREEESTKKLILENLQVNYNMTQSVKFKDIGLYHLKKNVN